MVIGHYLVLLTQDVVQNGCQIIMSYRMFQPSNYVVVKTGNFDNSLVEKKHKDIYVTQNANLGGSKHTIPEIGQRSNECKL